MLRSIFLIESVLIIAWATTIALPREVVGTNGLQNNADPLFTH